MTSANPRARHHVLGIVALSLFAALFTRLWYLQVLTTDELRAGGPEQPHPGGHPRGAPGPHPRPQRPGPGRQPALHPGHGRATRTSSTSTRPSRARCCAAWPRQLNEDQFRSRTRPTLLGSHNDPGTGGRAREAGPEAHGASDEDGRTPPAARRPGWPPVPRTPTARPRCHAAPPRPVTEETPAQPPRGRPLQQVQARPGGQRHQRGPGDLPPGEPRGVPHRHRRAGDGAATTTTAPCWPTCSATVGSIDADELAFVQNDEKPYENDDEIGKERHRGRHGVRAAGHARAGSSTRSTPATAPSARSSSCAAAQAGPRRLPDHRHQPPVPGREGPGRRDRAPARASATTAAGSSACDPPGAATVALDPRNGQVLAMASYPTYDPNLFVGGISTEDYQAIAADERTRTMHHNPLLNRAIAGTYAVGLHLQAVQRLRRAGHRRDHPGRTPTTTPASTSSAPATPSATPGAQATGSVDLTAAITKSSDTYFYKLGDESWLRRDAHRRDAAPGPDAQVGPRRHDRHRPPRRGRRPHPHPGVAARVLRRDQRGPGADEAGTWRGGTSANLAVGPGHGAGHPPPAGQRLRHPGQRRHRLPARAGRSRSPTWPASPTRWCPARRPTAGSIRCRPEWRDPLMAGFDGVTKAGTTAGAQRRLRRVRPVRVLHLRQDGHGPGPGKNDSSLFTSFAPSQGATIATATVFEQAGFGAAAAAPFTRQASSSPSPPPGVDRSADALDPGGPEVRSACAAAPEGGWFDVEAAAEEFAPPTVQDRAGLMATVPVTRRRAAHVHAARPLGGLAPHRRRDGRQPAGRLRPRRADGLQLDPRRVGPLRLLLPHQAVVLHGPGPASAPGWPPSSTTTGSSTPRPSSTAARCFLLVAVKLVGSSRSGTQGWFQLGPFQLQPSEFAKLALILGFTYLAVQFHGDIDLRRLGALLAVGGRAGGPRAAPARPGHRPGVGVHHLRPAGGGRGARAATSSPSACWPSCSPPLVLTSGVLDTYQKDRLTVFANQEQEKTLRTRSRNAAYNLEQSKIAIGSGGRHRQGPVQRPPDPQRPGARAAHRLHLHRGGRGAGPASGRPGCWGSTG